MAEFTWEVSGSGYEIPAPLTLDKMPADATPYDDRRILLPIRGKKRNPTCPLKDSPNLFLEFLHLTPNEASLIGFANKHGLLGLRAVEAGELLSEWAEQIYLVGQVFWRWEIHQGRVAWDIARAYVGPEFMRRTTDPRRRPMTTDREVFKQWQRDTEPLKASLRKQINADMNENMRRYCAYGSVLSADGALAWDHWPSTLLGAIWLQLLWHILGRHHWHVCPRRGCSEWVGNDTTKPGRKQIYCRPACKVAASKARSKARSRKNKRRRDARKGRG